MIPAPSTHSLVYSPLLVYGADPVACFWCIENGRYDGMALPRLASKKAVGSVSGDPLVLSLSLSPITSCCVVRTLRIHGEVPRPTCNCRNELRKGSSRACQSHESDLGSRCSSLSWASRWLQPWPISWFSASRESQGPILSNQIPRSFQSALLVLRIQSSYN